MNQERLKYLVTYNKETGIFVLKNRPRSDFIRERVWKMHNTKYAKKECSFVSERGYIRIRLDDRLYMAHRLAWLYEYGEFPKNETDHINHNKIDNRICNLRDATRFENCKNISLGVHNTSGILGVSWHTRDKVWMAKIGHEGKSFFLGYFDDIFEAICARKSANNKYNFHPNHGIINENP